MNNESFLKAIAAFSALPHETMKIATVIAAGLEDGPRKSLYEKLLVAEARMRVLKREEEECALVLESLMHTAQRDIRSTEEDSSRTNDESQVKNIESSFSNTK